MERSNRGSIGASCRPLAERLGLPLGLLVRVILGPQESGEKGRSCEKWAHSSTWMTFELRQMSIELVLHNEHQFICCRRFILGPFHQLGSIFSSLFGPIGIEIESPKVSVKCSDKCSDKCAKSGAKMVQKY